jgi:hypothetical protein
VRFANDEEPVARTDWPYLEYCLDIGSRRSIGDDADVPVDFGPRTCRFGRVERDDDRCDDERYATFRERRGDILARA